MYRYIGADAKSICRGILDLTGTAIYFDNKSLVFQCVLLVNLGHGSFI
jgi:hypothetical protein